MTIQPHQDGITQINRAPPTKVQAQIGSTQKTAGTIQPIWTPSSTKIIIQTAAIIINIPNVVAKVIPVQAPYTSAIIKQTINAIKDIKRKIVVNTIHKIPIAGEVQIITKKLIKHKNPTLFIR